MHRILLAVVAAAALAAHAGAQPGPARDAVRRFVRFVGPVRTAAGERRLAIHVWLIPNDHKVEALELPFRGRTVVEVRGGSVFTRSGGQRKRRRAGEFWTVPAGDKVSFETEDDSAAVQTTGVAAGCRVC